MKTMRRAAACALLLPACWLAGSLGAAPATSGDSLVIRTHFIGTTDLFADSAAARLKELWSLPGSAALRRDAVDRFARLPGLWLTGRADSSGALRPLVEDLLVSESHLEYRATPEFALAVRLTEARARAWDASLKQLAAGAKFSAPAAGNADGLAGWQAQRGAEIFRVGRAGEWTVVGCGREKLTLVSTLMPQLKQAWTKGAAWLEGDANLARLQGVVPLLADFKSLPLAHFSFSNRAEFVRTLVKLEFPRPHNWKPEPWVIPTNAIFDPLISFTAARGIAPVLDAIPSVHDVGWSPTPSQFTGWGLRGLPFQFVYATPARDVTNQLHKAFPKLNAVIARNGETNFTGVLAQTEGSITWQGLPLAIPHLGALPRDPGFLSFSMFPIASTKTPPPPELFQQLGRDSLVYYDWEITEDRVASWRQVYQLLELGSNRLLTPTNAPGERFLSDASLRLGECVTEAVATSPTEISIVRKSHLGLSSFELVALTRWIESTNFPAFGVFPPQPIKSATRPMTPLKPVRR